jgi:hypothetical protein
LTVRSVRYILRKLIAAMAKFRERRVAARARQGDLRTCPFCRAGLMQFQEPESSDEQPGWLCDNPACGYRTLARQGAKPSMTERRRAVVERAAKAYRKSMLARARAQRLSRDSERIRAATSRRRQ